MAGRVAHGNLPWTADENPDLPLGHYHHCAQRHRRHHLVEEACVSPLKRNRTLERQVEAGVES